MPLPSTASDLDTYGGSKENYLAEAVDPDTDLDCSEWNQLACDTAQMSRMAFQGVVEFDGYSPGSVNITPRSHQALWGTDTAPTIVYSSDGYGQATYTITLPETITDALSVSHSVNLSGYFIPTYRRTTENAGVELLHCECRKLSPNSFELVATAYDGSADAGDASTFTVFYK